MGKSARFVTDLLQLLGELLQAYLLCTLILLVDTRKLSAAQINSRFGAPVTNAVGAFGAINGMKR